MTICTLLLAFALNGSAPFAGMPCEQAQASASDDAPQAPAAPKKPAAASSSDSKVQVDLSVDANKSGRAAWWQMTPSVSVVINDYWSVEAGVPFYVVNKELSADGQSHVGLGDVYGNVSLDLSGDENTFYSTLSIGAPTGSVTKGLGFGQVTWDWSNHVERSFGVFIPFADVGLSNSLDLASRVNRSRALGAIGPPQALVGTLFNAEGGVELYVSDAVSISGSGYVTSPWGQQDVVTRTGPKGHTIVRTIAPEQSDRGVAATLSAAVNRAIDLSASFWRSATYHSNTVSFGIILHLSELSKK